MLGQLVYQFEPDGLGHVEVRGAGKCRQTVEPVDPTSRRLGAARNSPQFGARNPGRVADDQQWPVVLPGQITFQIEIEEVALADLDAYTPRGCVTLTGFAGDSAVATLDLDGLDLAGRRRAGPACRR